MKLDNLAPQTFMKPLYALAFAALAVPVMASPTAPAPVKMRDAATHEELSLKLREIDTQDPMRKMSVSKKEDPAKNTPKDLISQSDIISFGGHVTLVPKRAILQIPKSYADRIKYVPGSEIQGWADFYAANLGWITTVEISRVQAEGKEPLPEATRKQLSKNGNLIVAVYQGGPISMLPLKTPPALAATTPAKP